MGDQTRTILGIQAGSRDAANRSECAPNPKNDPTGFYRQSKVIAQNHGKGNNLQPPAIEAQS